MLGWYLAPMCSAATLVLVYCGIRSALILTNLGPTELPNRLEMSRLGALMALSLAIASLTSPIKRGPSLATIPVVLGFALILTSTLFVGLWHDKKILKEASEAIVLTTYLGVFGLGMWLLYWALSF